MLASILIKPGKIKIQEKDAPEPSYGEIVVKIKAALTCGTDLKAFKRGHHVIDMPGVFGHEFSGIVAKVGKGVRGFREGDEIMSVHSAPCLECSYCKKKAYNLCESIMYTKVLGAFAEYILLPRHIVKQNAFHKPKNLAFEDAAFLEPLSCVVHSLESLKIKKGDNAFIIGAGPIGLLHLLLLKKKGCKVAITDKHRKKLYKAKKLGADFVIKPRISDSPSFTPPPSREDYNQGNIPSTLLAMAHRGGGKGEGDLKINKFTNDIGFDCVFECTGMPQVWESSVDYVRRGGTVILFGGCPSGTKVTYDTARLHYDEITLKGVFHYNPSDVKKAYDLLCSWKLDLSRLISGRYRLNQIQKAFEKLTKGKGLKYAIIP